MVSSTILTGQNVRKLFLIQFLFKPDCLRKKFTQRYLGRKRVICASVILNREFMPLIASLLEINNTDVFSVV